MLIMMLALHWKQEEGFCFIHDGFLILGDFFNNFREYSGKWLAKKERTTTTLRVTSQKIKKTE